MATFNGTSVKNLIDSGDIATLEQLLAFAAEGLMELSGGSQYVPVINGQREFEYRTYQDFDGTGNLRLFVQVGMPCNIESFGTAKPKWKSAQNSVSGTLPVRYYTPNL